MEKNAKTMQQMAILAVLIILMVFLTIRLFRQLTPQPAQQDAENNTAAVNTVTPEKAPATGAPAGKDESKEDGVPGGPGGLADVKLNANQFRVFALSPAKSPFVQKEEWYAERLKEMLPGYPALKEEGYFDKGSLYLPKLDFILGSGHDWREVTLRRDASDKQYEIAGASADGLTNASIVLSEGDEETKEVKWTADSGVPLNELTKPGWEKRYPQLLEGGKEDDSLAGLVPGGMPPSDDLFGGENALGLPGGIGGLTSGEAQPDDMLCTGVSIRGGKAVALVSINGRVVAVKEGGTIAPRYQVLEIKSDGVVLVDTQDGSSKWAPMAQGTYATVAGGSGQGMSAGVPKSSYDLALDSIVQSTKGALGEITSTFNNILGVPSGQ